MGHFSERLATTITAQLIQWRLRAGDAVEGTVFLSCDPTYRDGTKMIFKGIKLTHFDYAQDFWPDHYIASTNTGEHFFLAARDQDASVA